MSTPPNSDYEYQVGLSLSQHTPLYVLREADTELREALEAGEFCYVLSSRQTGKSSLLARTKHHLQTHGIDCAIIYTSGLSEEGTTEDQWYAGLMIELVNKLNLSNKIGDCKEWWNKDKYLLAPVERFKEFLEKFLIENENRTKKIIVFMDEIDSIATLNFPIIDFFDLLRNCYEKRYKNPKYENLTFAYFGVAAPSELIRDKSSTAFSFGRTIELSGFAYPAAQSLELGLREKVTNPTRALMEVLKWTNGQPLLTQKLCKIIQDSPSTIPEGREEEVIKILVQEQVIENWEERDNPQHLQTIQERILGRGQITRRLLELYSEILQKGEVIVDISTEQMELRRSGLVVKKGRKLEPANEIYKAVFSKNWIDGQLELVAPYTEKLTVWLDSKCQDKLHLLQGEDLSDALRWAWGKSLKDEHNNFLSSSKKLEEHQNNISALKQSKEEEFQRKQQKVYEERKLAEEAKKEIKNRRLKLLLLIVPVMAVLGSIGVYQWKIKPSLPWVDSTQNSSLRVYETPEWFSSGERRLFSGKEDLNLERGIKAFHSGNYSKAIDFFAKAVDGMRSNPEARIYLNNAKARLKASQFGFFPFKLAVVVPVDNQSASAEEILRGVADAQTEFNKADGLNNRLLEIVIANDKNEVEKSGQLAKELAENSEILGVIVHNTSQLKDTQVAEYAKPDLAVIFTTSTNPLRTTNNDFFTTVFSENAIGNKLAKYVKNTLEVEKVVIFYNPNSNYSASLRQAFEEHFKQIGGTVVWQDNLSKPDLNIPKAVDDCVSKYQVRAVVLLPSTDVTSIAISIAKTNARRRQGPKLQILGGDVLYHPDTLRDGGETVEGLILAVPWFANTPYAERVKKTWGGNVSWRTATSYDATNALIKALSPDATRETVLKELRSINLTQNETAGYPLRFSETGDRSGGEPILVRVTRSAPAPNESEFGFQQLNENAKPKPGKNSDPFLNTPSKN
ncbi:ABC transporter substrate-binding protein [Microcoleus sp. F8_C2]